MSKHRWLILILVAMCTAAWAASCGSSETAGPVPPGTGASAAAGGAGAGTGAGGLNIGGNTPQDCVTSDDCDGGVCVNGICCSSADKACGENCCGDDEVCLFAECVTPGDPCLTNADCPDDYYCEPALAEQADGGVLDAGPDAVCTAPQPLGGRCVPLPPICGPNEDPPGCVEPCEYQPAPGHLNAVREWQWGYDPPPTEYSNRADVWSTPMVARIYDANCDGQVDLADPPQLVFVSGNSEGTCCQCNSNGGTCGCGSGGCAVSPSCCQRGVLRMLDGASGQEIWSLNEAKPGPHGFAGLSVAVGDIDGDKHLDIVALTGDGYVALIDAQGQVVRLSDQPVPDVSAASFGWGGALALGDMDGDGYPEISFAHTLFGTTGNAITRLWVGTEGTGGAVSRRMGHFADLDMNGDLELLVGRTAYRKDGSMLWNNATADGFTAIGDFDKNGTPEVLVVYSGTVRLWNGADGSDFMPALTLPGSGSGGPPVVADFDGDTYPEIGVAQADLYSMVKPNLQTMTLEVVWSQTTHDISSSITGSSVFDFEGDGKAEVVYNDECYLWVYDGENGDILFTGFTQSFTATESSMVADVDGDGHAEMIIMANGANTSTWSCAHHDQPGVIVSPHSEAFPVWEPPVGAPDYRGITVLGDAENSWVGTRTLWNQHAYSVTNICDPRDSACGAGSSYGQIPPAQLSNWEQPWLNNFRQNVQDEGLFDAPDAVVSLHADCVIPVTMQVSVRNVGLSGLPAGIDVEVVKVGTPEEQLGIVSTTIALLPGQTEVIPFVAPQGQASTSDTFLARIILPDPPTFHECRENNNESPPTSPDCVQ